MNLEVSTEVLKLADRCTQGYRCLKGTLAEPEVMLTGNPRFICHEPDPCAYKFPFGRTFFCTCPVRQEIYDVHGK